MVKLYYDDTEQEFGLPDITIPAVAHFNKELSQTDKIIFGIIRNLSHSPKGCWATNRYISFYVSVSADVVSKSISYLAKLEYLIVKFLRKNDNTTVREIHINPNVENIYMDMLRNRFLEIQHLRYPKIDDFDYTPIVKNNYPPPVKTPNNILDYNTTSREVVQALPAEASLIRSFSRRSKPVILPQEKTPNQKIYHIPKRHPAWQLITIWNAAPGYHRKHKIDPISKTLYDVRVYYDQLVNGTFFRNNKVESKLPLISNKFLQWEKDRKKFTYQEISKALEGVMLSYCGGYWPKNKKWLPKSLSSLIFNPRNNQSMLLESMIIPSKKLNQEIIEKEYDVEMNAEILKTVFAERNNNNVRTVNNFCLWMEKIHSKTWSLFVENQFSTAGLNFKDRFPSWQRFVNGYMEWRKEKKQTLALDDFRVGCQPVFWWFELLETTGDKGLGYEDEDFKIVRP